MDIEYIETLVDPDNIAYCKLEFLRTKTALNGFTLKYKLIVRANQVVQRF